MKAIYDVPESDAQVGVDNRGSVWMLAAARRLAEHRAGTGANLTRRAVRAGLVLELGRVWEDVPRSYEWTIKRKGNGNKICTLCGVTPRKRRTP